MSDKPQVIDLRKSSTAEDEQDPGRNPESEMNTESEGDVYENTRDLDGDDEEPEDGPPEDDNSGNVSDEAAEEYPEEAEEGEKSKEDEEEKAFSLRDFNLTQKLDEESGFDDLKEGSLVLIDTPLEAAKVGEVKSKEESWTGTLYVKVDTGGNEYEITPFNDEFSEKYIGTIAEEGSISPDLLQRLGKTEMEKVEVGNQVILDVPKMGPVRGTVSHKADTETQGAKIDVNTGPATFTLYEEPSPNQAKEQPNLIGQVQ